MQSEIIKVTELKIGNGKVFQLETAGGVRLGLFENRTFPKRGVLYRGKPGEVHIGLNGELIQMSPLLKTLLEMVEV